MDKKIRTTPKVSKTPVKLEYVPIYPRKRASVKKTAAVPKVEKIEQRFVTSAVAEEKSCDICALRKNGSCSSLRNVLCDDYRKVQAASAEDRNAYPQYGDATAIRKRDWKHFK